MEWIDVNDRLPEFDKKVLLGNFLGNSWFVGSLHEKVESKNGTRIIFWVNKSPMDQSEISHWMEIPEIPKRAKSKK